MFSVAYIFPYTFMHVHSYITYGNVLNIFKRISGMFLNILAVWSTRDNEVCNLAYADI